MNANRLRKWNRFEPLMFLAVMVLCLFGERWPDALLFGVLAYMAWDRNVALYGTLCLKLSDFHPRHQAEIRKVREGKGHTGQLSKTATLELLSKVINNRPLVIEDDK